MEWAHGGTIGSGKGIGTRTAGRGGGVRWTGTKTAGNLVDSWMNFFTGLLGT
jgi:hypothetical protein